MAAVHVAVELSGEYPTLPLAEAMAAAGLDGLARVVHQHGRAVVIDTGATPADLADRLALAWGAGELQAVTDTGVTEAVAAANEIDLPGGSFAVRARRLDTELPKGITGEVARRLGAALAERAPVDLDDPDVVVRVLLADRTVIAAPWAEVDRRAFEARHVRHRPFFMPITLHPRLARALANLAGAQPGTRVWDPFCGTGGILIEAGLLGARVVGSDIDERMIDGTRAALDDQGIEPEHLEVADVADAVSTVGRVDAIVTDPPYGQASPTKKEAVEAIYARAFEAAVEVLPAGGSFVVVLPSTSHTDRAPPGLELVEVHEVPVHGTLTRHVCRFVKQ